MVCAGCAKGSLKLIQAMPIQPFFECDVVRFRPVAKIGCGGPRFEYDTQLSIGKMHFLICPKVRVARQPKLDGRLAID